MDYKEKIEEVLTQVLTEKTFNIDVIEKIKSLKDGFESSTKLVDELKSRLDFITKENTQLNQKNGELHIKLDTYIQRENDISDKEKNLAKTNYELEFQKKRADEIKELMMIVFKNPVVRKSSYNNVNDYGNNKNESGATEITEE